MDDRRERAGQEVRDPKKRTKLKGMDPLYDGDDK